MSRNDSAISFRDLVHDLGAPVDFCGLLGCEVRVRSRPGFVQLALDGVAVNLNAVGGEGGRQPAGAWNPIQLRIADLDLRSPRGPMVASSPLTAWSTAEAAAGALTTNVRALCG